MKNQIRWMREHPEVFFVMTLLGLAYLEEWYLVACMSGAFVVGYLASRMDD